MDCNLDDLLRRIDELTAECQRDGCDRPAENALYFCSERCQNTWHRQHNGTPLEPAGVAYVDVHGHHPTRYQAYGYINLLDEEWEDETPIRARNIVFPATDHRDTNTWLPGASRVNSQWAVDQYNRRHVSPPRLDRVSREAVDEVMSAWRNDESS